MDEGVGGWVLLVWMGLASMSLHEALLAMERCFIEEWVSDSRCVFEDGGMLPT